MAADLDAYLARIGFQGPVRPDLATLKALHRAHLAAIPYENLDVQLGRPLTTDPEAAFDKLVRRGRGGWCYEMNGTLGVALRLAGFEVTRHAGDGTAPATHLVLTVALEEGDFACDVGFGDGPIEPYPLAEGPFSQAGFEFKLEREANGRWSFSNHRFGAAPGFSIGPPDEAAMTAACQDLQTSPDSPFVQHATLFLREGEAVVSLIDRTLRVIRPGGVTHELVADAAAYVATLKARFGLDTPQAAALWPALCARHEAYLAATAARKAAAAAAAG